MHPESLVQFNTVLGACTIAAQIMAPFLILLILFIKRTPQIIQKRIHATSGLFALLVALSAVAMPLIYSEVINFDACRLCWFQRIATFPQLLIIGIALIRRDITALWYSIPLSLASIGIGIHQYLLQFGVIGESSTACSTGVECSTIYIYQFGYITMPLMAVTANLFLILLLIVWYKTKTR